MFVGIKYENQRCFIKLTYVDYIFSGPLGSLGTLSQLENRIPLKPMPRGLGSVALLNSCTLTDSINETESAIFVSLMVRACRGSSIKTYFVFSADGVVPCGGRKTSPVYHHSADYIFSGPFGIIGPILSQFKNEVPLKLVLRGVGTRQCGS